MKLLNIKWTEEDMELFSKASNDCSPLHMNEEYARRTAFGRRIVFGGLGVLACLSAADRGGGLKIRKIEAEYLKPMFIGFEYALKKSEVTLETVIELLQGNNQMVKVRISFEGREDSSNDLNEEAGEDFYIPENLEIITDSTDYREKEYEKGIRVSGCYKSNPHMEELVERFNVPDMIKPLHMKLIMLFSYISGMVIPGKKGMSLGISLHFHNTQDNSHQVIKYEAVGRDYNKDYGLLNVEIKAFGGNGLIMNGLLKAMVRKEITHTDLSGIKPLLVDNRKFYRDKVALVIGGSRGLGAAIAQVLALQECRVIINYHKSHEIARLLQTQLEEASCSVSLMSGDASSKEWCREAAKSILESYRKLDILICNASNPIYSPEFVFCPAGDEESAVAKDLQLVSKPLQFFIDPLKDSEGIIIVVSSYITANHKDESLLKKAKMQREKFTEDFAANIKGVKCFIVRPPRMITDMNNTPIGLIGAESPAMIAANIINHLISQTSIIALP